MKKIFIIIISITFLCVNANAQTHNKIDIKNLLSKWEFYDKKENTYYRYYFLEDGIGFCHLDYNNEVISESVGYTLKGNLITLDYSRGGINEAEILLLTKNKMILKFANDSISSFKKINYWKYLGYDIDDEKDRVNFTRKTYIFYDSNPDKKILLKVW